jgi:hypothetical protein
MPDDIAERITAALAVESASRADETGVVSIGQARQRKLSRRAAQFLIAAASVAVLAVGGGLVVNSVTKDDPIAKLPNPSSTPTPETHIAASKLYLTHEGPADLTSEGFAAQAAKLLTIEEPPRGIKVDPPTAGKSPQACVNEVVGDDVKDLRPVKYDGQDAYLAITNPPNTDVIRAYVVTGCPSAGKIAKEDVLQH